MSERKSTPRLAARPIDPPSPRPRGGQIIHGLCGTRIYQIWEGMVDRTENKNRAMYRHYGGRGIKICPEWRHDAGAFARWAYANGYVEGLSIDRIDNDRDYEPSNCRLIPYNEQQRTMRKCRHLTAFGETKTAREWSRDLRCKVTVCSLLHRINRGWTHEAAISTPRLDPYSARHGVIL